MDVPTTGVAWVDTLVVVVTAVGGGIGAALTLRRRKSSDDKEISRDKSDTSQISRLQRLCVESDERAERERVARQAAEALVTNLATELERAKAEANYHREALVQQGREVRKLMRGLPKEVRRIMETDFVDFDDRPQPSTPPPEKKT